MSNPDADSDLAEIARILAEQETAWQEMRTAGANIQESSSTTVPPNSRFVFVRNGTLLNQDEVEAQITHAQPLYEFPLQANDEWIVGGADRNAYAPGYVFESGISFQTDAEAPSGQLLPDHLDLVEAGYATLFDQALSGVAHQDFAYSKEGAALHIERYDADIRIYKNGDVAAMLPRTEWEFDPFTARGFNGDPSDFWLVRIVGDLYGAGDITFFLRIRDQDGHSHLKELGTVGITSAPVMRVYNHQMHVRVEAASSATGSEHARLGPLQFHNRLDGSLPERRKTDTIRGATVQDDLGATDWTVVRVYRIDIDKREASTVAASLRAENTNNSVNAMVRTVHRDFLDFGAVNPDNDSNWVAPGQDTAPSNASETSVQVLDPAVAPADTVTIDTYTDTDEITKIRGSKELTTAILAGGGRQASQTREGASPFNELNYFVLVAQVNSAPGDVAILAPETNQRW